MKKVCIGGLILTVVFMILALTTKIPDKYIKSYGEGKMYEYVGGDAYNFIIEAGLRGGEIAGAYTRRTVYVAVSALLCFFSLMGLAWDRSRSINGSLSSDSAPKPAPIPDSARQDVQAVTASMAEPKVEAPHAVEAAPEQVSGAETVPDADGQ